MKKEILNYINKLFPWKKKPKLTKEQTEELMKHVKHAFEHDQADYDGMGNYGRFPPIRK